MFPQKADLRVGFLFADVTELRGATLAIQIICSSVFFLYRQTLDLLIPKNIVL